MARPRAALALLAVCVLMCVGAASASADGPVGADPTSNFPLGQLPDACDTAPTGAECMATSVAYLNAARASLGQPAYNLPSDFASLTAEQQMLVLTNLDRIQYGLPPIPGLTAALGQDAADGVQTDNDPSASDPNLDAWTANWAGGYPNLPTAYGAWMYDDGPGSGNLDCPSAGAEGCWGHRHNILWSFDGSGPLAMGAASGTDPQGNAGYAMLIAQGGPKYHPSYTFTWSSVVGGSSLGGTAPGGGSPGGGSAGGSTPSTPVVTPPKRIALTSVRVRGHKLVFRLSAPSGAALRCTLTRRGRYGFGSDRFRACNASTTISVLRPGRYRLRIKVAGGNTVTRFITVH